jgi:hypothetical protein
MMETCKFVVEIVSALLVPTLAGFGAFIAYKQKTISEEKLKLDLYDRRFMVYDQTMKVLALIMKDAKCNLEDLLQFKRETAQAKFLFSEEVTTYLDAIYKKGLKLHRLNFKLHGDGSPESVMYEHGKLPVGMERSLAAEEVSEILGWVGEQFEVSLTVFNKYLRFKQLL